MTKTRLNVSTVAVLVTTQHKYTANSGISLDSFGNQYKCFATYSVTDQWKWLVKSIYPNTSCF